MDKNVGVLELLGHIFIKAINVGPLDLHIRVLQTLDRPIEGDLITSVVEPPQVFVCLVKHLPQLFPQKLKNSPLLARTHKLLSHLPGV